LGGSGPPGTPLAPPLILSTNWEIEALKNTKQIIKSSQLHTSTVPSPRGGFGGLSPPKQSSKSPKLKREAL